MKKPALSSEEDDRAVEMHKHETDACVAVKSIAQETLESSRSEEISEEGLIPESIGAQNLDDEEQITQKSTTEVSKKEPS